MPALLIRQKALSSILGCCLALLCAAPYAADLQILADENRPLSFSENGQPKGLCVEVTREIQRRTGDKSSIQIQPWPRAYRAVSAEPNVAVFAMARTAAREELFQWVGPVSASRASLYGRRGSGLVINSLEDAKAVDSIMVVRDFYTQQLLQKLGFTNLELVPRPEVMVKMALNDRAPLMFTSNVTLPELLEKAGAKPGDLEPLFTVTSIQTYIAFSASTSKDIVAKWQAALDHMKRDGTYAAIYAKWLPGEAPTKIKPEPILAP